MPASLDKCGSKLCLCANVILENKICTQTTPRPFHSLWSLCHVSLSFHQPSVSLLSFTITKSSPYDGNGCHQRRFSSHPKPFLSLKHWCDLCRDSLGLSCNYYYISNTCSRPAEQSFTIHQALSPKPLYSDSTTTTGLSVTVRTPQRKTQSEPFLNTLTVCGLTTCASEKCFPVFMRGYKKSFQAQNNSFFLTML